MNRIKTPLAVLPPIDWAAILPESIVFIDWESRSEVSVTDVGNFNYATHPSTEPMCLGWTVGPFAPAKTHRFLSLQNDLFAERTHGDGQDLSDLFRAIQNGATVVAHNVEFDRALWDHYAVPKLGFPPVPENQWACSSARAANFGIPRGLKDACEFLQLEHRKFAPKAVEDLRKPRKSWTEHRVGQKWETSPGLFLQLYTYCENDVEACRELWYACPPLPEEAQAVWEEDRRINRRGFPIDRKLVEYCKELHERNLITTNTELKSLTNGAVKKATEIKKLREWLCRRGVVLPDGTKESVRDALLRNDLPAECRTALELRQFGAGAASAKYAAFLNAVNEQDRVCGTYIFNGGRLGRFSAKNPQPHNLIKPVGEFDDTEGKKLARAIAEILTEPGGLELAKCFGSERDILAAMLRASICAPNEHVFIVVDFGQVEARITAWLAGQQDLVDLFASGRDVYTDMAIKIDPNNPNRALGKEAVLGLGFGMWVDTFAKRCASRGIIVAFNVVEKAVLTFRETYYKIPEFWENMATAAQNAITYPGRVFPVGYVKWLHDSSSGILRMVLPSGRAVFYHRARVVHRGIEYWAKTGSDETGAVGWCFGRGSRLTENAAQATAADLLRGALLRLPSDVPDVSTVFHTHDEIAGLTKAERIEEKYEAVVASMIKVPWWAPGLPIAADGWHGRRNRK